MSQFDHWMRFHVGDYLADTMHLSTFQHGIYLRLILHYFKHGTLPAEERDIARVAGVNVPIWRRESAPVAALFKHGKQGWRHTRIDAEREHARQVSERRKEAGLQGAKRKWAMANAINGDGNCHSDDMANAISHGWQTSRARARPEPEPQVEEGGKHPLKPPQESPSKPPPGRGEALFVSILDRKGRHHDGSG